MWKRYLASEEQLVTSRVESSVEFMMLGQDVWVRWPELDLKMKLGPKDTLIDEMCRFAAAIDIGDYTRSESLDFT